MPTPSSSRVKAYRFDHLQRQLQVTWRNEKNEGYLRGCRLEGYRAFARVASKGKYINRILNNYTYRPMNSTEYEAPSNERRKGIGSRVST